MPNFDGLASAEFIVLPESGCVSSSFLKHRLSAVDFVSFASHLNEGDRPRVSFDQIGRFKILIPPLHEQRRIVNKIDELFSELDACINSLQKARAQLATYRQSVLKHAFEGKLTVRWRERNNDQPESHERLLSRVRQARIARYNEQLGRWRNKVNDWEEGGRGGSRPKRPAPLRTETWVSNLDVDGLSVLPAGWAYVSLGLLTDEPKYGTSKKCDYNYVGTGVLRIPNVVNGVINTDDLKGALFNDNDLATFSLMRGDVLMIRSNGSISIVGTSAIVSEPEEEYLFAGYLMRLRGIGDVITPEYLVLVLSSQLVRIQVEEKAKSTSGVNNINAREVQSVVVPLCSVNEQLVVVEELRTVLNALDNFDREIKAHMSAVSALRQSILRRAFRGQLVPRDTSEEPASVMLDRINTQREQLVRRPTRRGRARE